ncbi:MAG: uridine diphosphate-N-acetylglucosamine-binding protein YvcK [Deltaproteobacteria bacterium]|nr:uridine diphosphate-N-acetylglucosamine-binding protein YvcK [Deltaproteobacteria bacterium]
MIGETYNILTIGGGSGQFALLSGLRDLNDIAITSVVSMSDNGGSTGRLRDELGILPPGDALKCVIALSPFRDVAQRIMLKKIRGEKRLQGHNAGNMLLTMLSRYTGNFPAAINTLSEIFEIKGRVLPGTTYKVTLVAELTDGSRIYGESAIDIPQSIHRAQIKDLFLVPHYNNSISAYPPAIQAIEKADYIFIGPGDLYTSIIASLIIPGIKEALQKSDAKIIYILNIMTKFGETHNFKAYDFIRKIEHYLNRQVDVVVCNTRMPRSRLLKKYEEEKAEFVEIEKLDNWIGSRIIYADDLLDTSDDIARHDSRKLASLIQGIVFSNHTHMNNACYYDKINSKLSFPVESGPSSA